MSIVEAAAAAVVFLLLVDLPIMAGVVVDRFNVGRLKLMAKKLGVKEKPLAREALIGENVYKHWSTLDIGNEIKGMDLWSLVSIIQQQDKIKHNMGMMAIKMQ